MKNIVRLSDLSPEERARKVAEMVADPLYKSPPAPRGLFDYFGTRYDLEHLKEIGGNLILFPLEHIAEYVDGQTKRSVDIRDMEFLRLQILSTNVAKIDLSQANATSLGNIAYVALHSKSEEARAIAEQLLEKYYKYFMSNKG